MKKHNKKIHYVLSRWIILLTAVLTAFAVMAFRIRDVVLIFAQSEAKNVLLNASNKAILDVFDRENIKYDDLSHVCRDLNGNVTDIQIDTACINRLKNRISTQLFCMTEKDDYIVSIPFGTLLNTGFTTGFGPQLKFKMSLAHTSDVYYKSAFCDSGINNVLHQIIIVTDIKCSVLSFGTRRSFSFSNEVIAASSVIAGKVPESYTSVYETDPEKYADDIFNYSK